MRINLFFLFISIAIGCHRKFPDRWTSDTNLLKFEPIIVKTIDVGPRSIGPCEPSICINPNNSNHIVAGAVLDNVYVSHDAGSNWTKTTLKSSHGVFGDPVVRFTKDGRPLYAHLTNAAGKAYSSKEFLDRIVIQRSDDSGKKWNDGSFPKVDFSKDHDKEWMTVAPDGTILITWTEFDKYGSSDSLDRSKILFSKSMDNGSTWTDAVVISEQFGDCLDGDMTTEGAFSCVGVDGSYYVVWSYNEKLYLDISYDKGLTWKNSDIVVAQQSGGWSYDIPGIGRSNGMPVMVCDHSKGRFRGRIYITWSDQSNGKDNTDIWLIYSDDKGKSWSSPAMVNNDYGENHQFFSSMDIDDTNGNLFFVFYDRRNHADLMTDVFIAYSTNGGKSFDNIKISDRPFLTEDKLFFGDYNDISCHNNIIRPIWTRQDGNILSVQTAIINIKK